MSEAMEMYEGIESIILDMIDEHKNAAKLCDSDVYWNGGAIYALKELLRRLNED